MATLNAFTFDPGKPMIWNKESAYRFLDQCRQPFYLRTRNGYYQIHQGRVGLYEKVDEWTDLQRWELTGEDAVNAVWRLRKYINARFKD